MSSMRESVPERQSCALAVKAVHSTNRRAAEIRRGMPVSFDYQGTTGGGAIQALVRLQENSFEPWTNTTEHGGRPEGFGKRADQAGAAIEEEVLSYCSNSQSRPFFCVTGPGVSSVFKLRSKVASSRSYSGRQSRQCVYFPGAPRNGMRRETL